MAVTYNRGDGIVILGVATDEVVFDYPTKIENIIIRGTAAGAFVIELGNASITVNNSATALTVTLPVNRKLNKMKLVSGPTAAQVTAFLEKK